VIIPSQIDHGVSGLGSSIGAPTQLFCRGRPAVIIFKKDGMNSLSSSTKSDPERLAMVAATIGAVALGAFAIGALAIRWLGVGTLRIGSAKIGALEVDELTVRRLRMPPPPAATP
jgi:hypothetical protein